MVWVGCAHDVVRRFSEGIRAAGQLGITAGDDERRERQRQQPPVPDCTCSFNHQATPVLGHAPAPPLFGTRGSRAARELEGVVTPSWRPAWGAACAAPPCLLLEGQLGHERSLVRAGHAAGGGHGRVGRCNLGLERLLPLPREGLGGGAEAEGAGSDDDFKLVLALRMPPRVSSPTQTVTTARPAHTIYAHYVCTYIMYTCTCIFIHTYTRTAPVPSQTGHF